MGNLEVRETINAYKVLVEKPKAEKQSVKAKHKFQYNKQILRIKW